MSKKFYRLIPVKPLAVNSIVHDARKTNLIASRKTSEQKNLSDNIFNPI